MKLGYSLDLIPQFKLQLLQLCSVCGQNISGKTADDERIEAGLVGYKNFGACPCCGRIVRDNNAAYQHKAHRWVTREMTLLQVANASLRGGKR